MKNQSKGKLVSGHQAALLAAIAITGAVYFIPFLRLFFLPLVYLSTHIHEFCHALTAILTGGAVDYIKVFSNGSGVTLVEGGNQFLVDSAGYLGATTLGIVLILFGRTAARAKIAFGVLGVVMVCSTRTPCEARAPEELVTFSDTISLFIAGSSYEKASALGCTYPPPVVGGLIRRGRPLLCMNSDFR